MIKTKTLAASAAILAGGVVSANAALLDFTVDGSLSGTFQGVGYSVTGSPQAPNTLQEFDGDASAVPDAFALENDGIGIGDDELSFGEVVTVRFERAITVNSVYFLDLFQDPNDQQEEVAVVTGDAVAAELTFDAFEDYPGTGFAEGEIEGGLTGTVFTFTARNTNDGIGEPDYALAGLEVADVAPIPVPAAGLLLLGGLGALGAVKRRKS